MREPCLERILMTGDTVGGVWTFALELAEALGAHGIEVIFAAMSGKASDAQRADAQRVPNLRLHTADFKLEWMEQPWEDVAKSGAWLLQLEKRYEPDVVHLNTFGHGALAWDSPLVMTAHSCVLSWWAAVKDEPVPICWQRYRREVARAIRSVDLLTAPSQAMLACLEQNYGRHFGPDLPDVRVIPNGRRMQRFRTAAKEPFILSAGRLWDEAKNVGAVARVAPDLPWPVYLAGGDRSPDGATVRFEGCHVLGKLAPSDLAGWYSRASIYALPARYEPSGLSALEAALSGCALVLGDIASLREIWHDAAVYVPPENSGALEGALRALIADPVRRELMARRAAARARIFNPERMARGYLEAYADAAGSRRTACAS